VRAARLDSALSRLREVAPAPPPASELDGASPAATAPAAAKPWLGRVFRMMVERDPALAGRLAVALLPAQPLVHPLPLAYDLILSDLGCVALTAAGGRATVQLRDLPRHGQEVQLRVRGELASLARLLASGRARRILRRGLARTSGDRATLGALRALVRAPLSLAQLHAAGVTPDSALALALIAAMIDPSWTKGEQFTIAHCEPEAAVAAAGLRVRDGAPVAVVDPAQAQSPTTTVIGPATSLLAVFGAIGGAEAPILGAGGGGDAPVFASVGGGDSPVFGAVGGAEAVIQGDGRPLALVQSWVKRAQSG
jgi:hypothetical protein